ncbi:E3 ubiquitin-protein ligase KCMF1-like isoform X1 [Anopheles albimanus]|uniref:E3 ubiquitin-protein ligase KCMF1-like isoform X1 n=2 Tax=Anopheles albimanus TaxID=7167 RepID=UPI001640F636|nr:E3 ubiquitin-protein ligase KCMF1-like isoform X1 [Anopheles albimanus]XP_035778542.1 E3 ubiquitin-protein ligase KCMF1-like isoform X1 [Anopheles albimanus]XP_035778543.1 E3 ubiquitin-protein ligase KCMF1-like isoform X1 [Anopheles albimanus]XP_035778544.1 E3 ubiquitin-protein ligase KCMF1-like isoform X1 [Anopheles albimanus]XP_035778545.1 E3 ubiquitin-protein ligase KCMF1-like isoform X1 [Anopheles albimanus]
MSRHEGVSCDSCLKSNFRGRRYKCLICYDYDLCANCYEEGATTTRHSADHPMQCILTQSDFELYYGGEVLPPDQPQSFTCPYCKRMGLSDAALLEHVSAEHNDTGLEVVCPVCAALPGGEPNFVTDDFARHLSLEHRSGSRDLISFLDEPSAIRHGGVRRMPHSGRALGGPRSRRSNMHFSSSGGGLSTLSPSGRESVDPIAELLQQLSNVRRGGAPQPSQLHQLHMQIQLERQQVTAARQQLERLPRRSQQQQPTVVSSASASNATGVNNNAIGSGSTQTSHNSNHTIITLNAGSGGGGRDAPIASASSSTSMPIPIGLVGVSNILGPIGGGSAGGQPGGSGTSSQQQQHQHQQQQQQQQQQSQFLMARFMAPTMDEAEQAQLERDRADRSQFVQALMLSTIANLQAFNKSSSSTADEELSEELSSLNLGVEHTGGGGGGSTVNSSIKRPATDDVSEEGQQHEVGGAMMENNGSNCGGGAGGNCDSYKLGADSHDSVQGRGGSGGKSAIGKGGQASAKPGAGGATERRPSSRQTPPSSGGSNAAAAKARELKQANAASNTSTSRQQHHVPDTR